MKTTNLLEDGMRHVRRLLALMLMMMVAACGPGSGGTGTGPDLPMGSLTFFGGRGGGFVNSPGLPSCIGDCGGLHLRLEESSVELRTTCFTFVHTGAWSVDAAGKAVLAGTLQTATTAGSRTAPATLQLQFPAEPGASSQVTLTLVDEAGSVVVPTQTLPRVEGAVAPSTTSCPG